MKISEQVVSLELAKEMKELGLPQDSFWSWQIHKKWKTKQLILSMAKTKPEIFDFYSAPTVSEIGERLPNLITIHNGAGAKNNMWCIIYDESYKTYNGVNQLEYSNNFADAMAKMWIYLKKEGLL